MKSLQAKATTHPRGESPEGKCSNILYTTKEDLSMDNEKFLAVKVAAKTVLAVLLAVGLVMLLIS